MDVCPLCFPLGPLHVHLLAFLAGLHPVVFPTPL